MIRDIGIVKNNFEVHISFVLLQVLIAQFWRETKHFLNIHKHTSSTIDPWRLISLSENWFYFQKRYSDVF